MQIEKSGMVMGKWELFTGFPGEKKLCPKNHTMILSAITIYPRIFFPVGIK
jgi:hypothetical protein